MNEYQKAFENISFCEKCKCEQCRFIEDYWKLEELVNKSVKLDEALKDAISILSGSGRCPHNCGYPCRETGKEDCQACWIKYFDEIYLIGDLKK